MQESDPTQPLDFQIRAFSSDPLEKENEQAECVQLMVASDPWQHYQFSMEMCHNAIIRAEHVRLAVMNYHVVGFVIWQERGPFSGYLQTVCVSGDYRRLGVGSALLNQAEQAIFSRFANMFLCVSDFNDLARTFYERKGYSVVGELKHYLKQDVSEWLMRKSIRPLLEKPHSG